MSYRGKAKVHFQCAKDDLIFIPKDSAKWTKIIFLEAWTFLIRLQCVQQWKSLNFKTSLQEASCLPKPRNGQVRERYWNDLRCHSTNARINTFRDVHQMHLNHGKWIAEKKIPLSQYEILNHRMLCSNINCSWFWHSVVTDHCNFYRVNWVNRVAYTKYQCRKVLARGFRCYGQSRLSICTTYYKGKETWSAPIYCPDQKLKLGVPTRYNCWWYWAKNGFLR